MYSLQNVFLFPFSHLSASNSPNQSFALKIYHKKFKKAGQKEAFLLHSLKEKDKSDHAHILSLIDYFVHEGKNHSIELEFHKHKWHIFPSNYSIDYYMRNICFWRKFTISPEKLPLWNYSWKIFLSPIEKYCPFGGKIIRNKFFRGKRKIFLFQQRNTFLQ